MDRGDSDSVGIRFLKKGRRGVARLLFSRVGLIVLLFALQILLIAGVFVYFEKYLSYAYVIQTVFIIVMLIYLINCDYDPSAKITWLVLILLAPLAATVFLLYNKLNIGNRILRDRLGSIVGSTKNALPQDRETMESMENEHPVTTSLVRYLNRSGCFPVYENCSVDYFPLGEDKFEAMLKELEKAEHFIFLEYFVIEEGLMWGRVLEILARKAKAGVEVRLMYDGTNEFFYLPASYPAKLASLGIKCKRFAPLTPFVSTHYNYRDHRKILVIDGNTAFTGGVNLADRYINRERVFGHWKDTAVMVKGAAAQSFTLMFLQMWNIDEKRPEYEPYISAAAPTQDRAPGYVIPYGDSPLDEYRVGELVYMDILNRARDYVHIMTPYLILDGEMETALRFAAQRGVEVCIILPGIADKKAINALAKTHYASLLKAGVKIYEYTPGFVHAKSFVSDGRKAVVGTINLDYRSLYHHFECAVFMLDVPCIADIETDFQATVKQCREVKLEDTKKLNLFTKLIGYILKAFASLL